MQKGEKPLVRRADPYRDLDVIDERAPRVNQSAVALICALAIVTGWWWLASLMGLQLAVGLLFGRRYCLTCLFYFEVVQPRIGEGDLEDARPPRFANILGALFLGVATAAHLLGWSAIGWALIAIVAALAALAAATGLCVGCEMYRVAARLRGIRPGSVERVDLNELGASGDGTVTVAFGHPLCTGCDELERKLADTGARFIRIDVSERPEIARKYHVSVVPTAFAVDADGRVLERIA
jgi:hypothetical protein